jgi:HK97 family phage prohead protease
MAATATATNQQSERREAPSLMMRAALVPESVDEEDRSVEVTWSTGADVTRRDWWTGERYVESLSMEPAHVRLDRLNSGAPVLDTHSAYSTRSVLGVIVSGSAKLDGKTGVARVRFSKRADVDPVWEDVRAGILRNVSVGYAVHTWDVKRNAEGKLEKRTAVDWEPYEISIVPVPADAGAQVRSVEDDFCARGAQRSEGMTPEELEAQKRAAEEKARREAEEATRRAATEGDEQRARAAMEADRKRSQAILELCRKHGIEATRAESWVAEGATVDAVRTAILDSIAERQAATHVTPITHGGAERGQSAVRDASDALLRRAGHKVEGEGHRNFGDANLLDLARSLLEMGGVNTRTLNRNEIAQRALGTGDYASVLYVVGEKLVRAGYDSFPMVHREIFRRSTASDFRAKNRIVVEAGETLPEVPESGIIQRSSAKAEMASYAIKTYAKIIPITRKLIIDDDFGFFESVSRARGRSAAETERKVVWDFVKSNPTAPDGNAVFDNTNHGNYPAASASPISATTLSAARSAIRMAKSLDGTPINSTLAHIVTTDAGETEFDVLLNGLYVPTSTTGAVTERMRRVKLHVEPLIDATKKHWYGFTDVNQVETFEYAYLAGAEGVRVEQRVGFDVEGIELKVALDFGVGIIDHRGCYYQRQT